MSIGARLVKAIARRRADLVDQCIVDWPYQTGSPFIRVSDMLLYSAHELLTEHELCRVRRLNGIGYLGEGSPDRVDAMVWALTQLMLGSKPAEITSTTVRGLY